MPPEFYCKFLALPAKVAEDTITKVRKVDMYGQSYGQWVSYNYFILFYIIVTFSHTRMCFLMKNMSFLVINLTNFFFFLFLF